MKKIVIALLFLALSAEAGEKFSKPFVNSGQIEVHVITYNADETASEDTGTDIPNMEDLLLQVEDTDDDYEITEEELWVPPPKSPQSSNTRATQPKIYG